MKESVVKIDDGELSLWVRANRYPYRIDVYKRKRTWYWHVMREVAGHTTEFYGGKNKTALDALKVALLGAVAASNVEKEQWNAAKTVTARSPRAKRPRNTKEAKASTSAGAAAKKKTGGAGR